MLHSVERIVYSQNAGAFSVEREGTPVSLGIAWHDKTAKERKIMQLDDELKVIDLYKGQGRDVNGSNAESYFVAWTKERHKHRVLRGGWPDFLLKHEETGEVFAVEVKTSSDRLSRRQAACFVLLEQVGLKVYVWMPSQPKRLTPWRLYLRRNGRFRADGGKIAPDAEVLDTAMRWSKNQAAGLRK